MNKSLFTSVNVVCRKICVLFCAITIALPPPAFGMMRSQHVDHPFDDSVRYGSKPFMSTEEGGTLTTPPVAPTQGRSQACGSYQGRSQPVRESFEGRDMRLRIETTDVWPYSIHGQLDSYSARGTPFSGSGVLVGPQHFLTAAHCVHDHRMDGWAESLMVHLALNDRSAPFGAIRGTRAYLYKEWVEGENPDFDLALVVLEKAVGPETGWAGMLALAEEELRDHKVHVTGYPGESTKRGQMWTMEDTLDRIDAETFSYKIHTSGGQSGGGIWINKWGSPFLLGVHTSAYGGRNFGVRLSRAKIQDLVRWMEATGKITSPQAVVSSVSSPPSAGSSSGSRVNKDDLLAQAQSGDRKSLGELVGLAEIDTDAWAQYSLGKMFEEGEGVAPDLQKALRLYKMAAAQNYRQARNALERLVDDGEEEAQPSFSGRGRKAVQRSVPSSSQQRPKAPVSVSRMQRPPSPEADIDEVESEESGDERSPSPILRDHRSGGGSGSSAGRSSAPRPVAAAAAAASSSTAVTKVPRSLGDGLQIPEIARGYEEVYQRFLRGKLIFRPNGDGNDRGMITLSIADLKNPLNGKSDPLNGTFDLTNCGETGKYLSISTGYRNGKIPANANKMEIWFTPKFVADKAVAQVQQNHYLHAITTPDKWDGARAPVGIFWTWGGWDDLSYVDYLTTQNMDDLGNENLYKKGRWAREAGGWEVLMGVFQIMFLN